MKHESFFSRLRQLSRISFKTFCVAAKMKGNIQSATVQDTRNDLSTHYAGGHKIHPSIDISPAKFTMDNSKQDKKEMVKDKSRRWCFIITFK